jgi:hypothetical protein
LQPYVLSIPRANSQLLLLFLFEDHRSHTAFVNNCDKNGVSTAV